MNNFFENNLISYWLFTLMEKKYCLGIMKQLSYNHVKTFMLYILQKQHHFVKRT